MNTKPSNSKKIILALSLVAAGGVAYSLFSTKQTSTAPPSITGNTSTRKSDRKSKKNRKIAADDFSGYTLVPTSKPKGASKLDQDQDALKDIAREIAEHYRGTRRPEHMSYRVAAQMLGVADQKNIRETLLDDPAEFMNDIRNVFNSVPKEDLVERVALLSVAAQVGTEEKATSAAIAFFDEKLSHYAQMLEADFEDPATEFVQFGISLLYLNILVKDTEALKSRMRSLRKNTTNLLIRERIDKFLKDNATSSPL